MLKKRGHKSPALGVMYGRDPKQLGFFLAQVWTYMPGYGPDITTKGTKVWGVTMALEGTAANWMVTLHNDNALELDNFDHFMAAL